MPAPHVIPKIILADGAANRFVDQLLAVLNPILRNVAGDLDGPVAAPSVVAWRGLPLASSMAAPGLDQVPKWNGREWAPGVAGTAGAVTSVGATSPLASSGGTTPTISLTGTVATANGGTGLGGATPYAAGDLLFAAGVSTLSRLAIGTAGQVLFSNGSAPVWGTPAADTTGASVGAYRATSSTPATFALSDYVLDVTGTGAFVVNLPTAGSGVGQAPTGRVFVIKNSGGATITVTPGGSQTIDTAATFVVQTQFASFTFVSKGNGWAVL